MAGVLCGACGFFKGATNQPCVCNVAPKPKTIMPPDKGSRLNSDGRNPGEPVLTLGLPNCFGKRYEEKLNLCKEACIYGASGDRSCPDLK